MPLDLSVSIRWRKGVVLLRAGRPGCFTPMKAPFLGPKRRDERNDERASAVAPYGMTSCKKSRRFSCVKNAVMLVALCAFIIPYVFFLAVLD